MHTIERLSLRIPNSFIFTDEEVEFLVRVFNGANLVLFVDVISVCISML